MAELKQIELPCFGSEPVMPAIAAPEYEARLAQAVERMAEAGLEVLVVYGDREHFANLAFLTGFDPRFEEAVLLLDSAGRRLLLVGNECLGYVGDEGPELEVRLVQDFSLLGQPRDRSPKLRGIFRNFGVAAGTRVGCVGWKVFRGGGGVEAGALDVPAYLADLLRELAGAGRVRNATGLFTDPADGLRAVSSAAQIAQFEYAATRVSDSVRSVIQHVAEGVSERELAGFLRDAGLPRSCHAMISSGEKVRRGLASPSDKLLGKGDPFVVAFGVWGALTCRAGAVAAGPEDLPGQAGEFFGRLAGNYFDVVAGWYESIRVGATGGEVFAAADARRNPGLFDFALNPGHLIHLDEWVHSPFSSGCDVALRSGMAVQMDIIPVSRGPAWTVNAEDGIALADEPLRQQMAREFPACRQRIEARRAFMRERLGIAIDDSVLPLSNMPAVLAPYLLRPDRVLTTVAPASRL